MEYLRVVRRGPVGGLWAAETLSSIGDRFLAVFMAIAVTGAADAITGPALDALVPTLVAAPQLRSVMGLMDLTSRLTWVVGPAAAGAALALLPTDGLFIVDAVTFAVSAGVLGLVHRASAGRVAVAGEPETEVVTQSARVVVRRHPRIGAAVLLAGVGEFCQAAFAVGIPIWVTVRLHAGLGAYGLVISSAGVGALVGNLRARHVRMPGGFLAG